MEKSVKDFTDEELEEIVKQIERAEFEKLQHRTTIPTVFLKDLLDSPANWLLQTKFFDTDYKDKSRAVSISNLIKSLETIAIEDCKELLEEQDYYVDFYKEEPIMYRGSSIGIRISHNDIYLESLELNCLDFHTLCDCVQLKAYAKLYFENEKYEASFYCLNLASYIFGAAVNKLTGENDFQRQLSKTNKAKAKKRWTKHNEARAKKKRQYLNIMREQKFTTFADTATYIKQHIDTDSKPSHDTIKRWLSQANKGDFS